MRKGASCVSDGMQQGVETGRNVPVKPKGERAMQVSGRRDETEAEGFEDVVDAGIWLDRHRVSFRHPVRGETIPCSCLLENVGARLGLVSGGVMGRM